MRYLSLIQYYCCLFITTITHVQCCSESMMRFCLSAHSIDITHCNCKCISVHRVRSIWIPVGCCTLKKNPEVVNRITIVNSGEKLRLESDSKPRIFTFNLVLQTSIKNQKVTPMLDWNGEQFDKTTYN